MPRAKGENRGGNREGASGKTYGNRTDLNDHHQAVQAGPSRGYGQRAALEQQQRAVPLPSARPVASPAAPQAQAVAPPVAPPAPMDRPTERTDEPITHGLSTGPGAGPEAVGMGQPDLGRLVSYLPALEILASRPGATEEMRNFVRTVRSNAPIGVQ